MIIRKNNKHDIDQLDGSSSICEEKNKPVNEVSEEKKESPVIFKMLENGYAECKQIPAGETPPDTVFHPELKMGRNPIRTEWGDRVWFEYVFEVDNVQMEIYQVV